MFMDYGGFGRTRKILDWWDYVKGRLRRTAPPYIGREVDAIEARGGGQPLVDLRNMTEEKLQRAMMAISWIYSDIDYIARSAASTPLRERRIGNMQKDVTINTAFEKLWHKPNNFMTRTFLLRHMIYWLNLSRHGAFLYMAPNRNNLDEILEIWPVNSNRITPVINRDHFVKEFLYTTDQVDLEGRRKKHRINEKYIVWLRYPDPFNYWGSLPPLWAAIRAAEIEEGLLANQKKFYVEGRGLPMTLISVDKDIPDPDYAQVRADIRSDWESDGRTLAIARAGTISTESLGFTQRDLESLGNQALTRDRIDSIFFGFPIRSSSLSSAEGLKQIDRIIKEQTIHPLLTLISEQLTLQMMGRFFDEEAIAEFDDVRTSDRALTIQERTIRQNWATVETMLLDEGQPLFEVPDMPDYVKLPVRLATNPSFVSMYYGFGQGVDGGNIEKPEEVGNLPEAQDAQSLTNQLARDDTRTDRVLQSANKSSAETIAIKAEMKRWKTVAKRSLTRNGNAALRQFKSDIIPDWAKNVIIEGLETAQTKAEIDAVFDVVLKWE